LLHDPLCETVARTVIILLDGYIYLHLISNHYIANGYTLLNIKISFPSCLKLRNLNTILSLLNDTTQCASQGLLFNCSDASFEYIFARKKVDMIMLTGIYTGAYS